MLGDSTIRYIYDTHNLNIICIISYFDIFPFFREFLPLKHICYYYNEPTPYSGPSRCLFFNLKYIFVQKTGKPRLFIVFVLLYLIPRQQYRQMLRLRDLHTQS